MLCAIIGTYANIRQREPEKYQDLKLSYLGFAAATGEARRIRGDYILTENDVEQHSIFQDAAAAIPALFACTTPATRSMASALATGNGSKGIISLTIFLSGVFIQQTLTI